MQGQWFPGNMARATAQLEQDLKIVDLVVELLDARIPFSSSNPVLSRLIGTNSHLILLHKADRAEKPVTDRWLSYYKSIEKMAMAFSIHDKSSLARLQGYLKQQGDTMQPKRLKRPLRLMVIGIPNVGKSTLINYFVRKAATRTGNQPGITRGRQWIRIMNGIELLDTPGVLWPKIDEETIFPLAAVGAIPLSKIETYDLATWLLEQYRERNKLKLLMDRYPDLDVSDTAAMLRHMGAMYGCLKAEGRVDYDRVAALLLKDFQGGSLGRLTLEEPNS